MKIRDLRWLFIPIFVTPIVIGWLVGRIDVGVVKWATMWSSLMLVISTCFLVLVTGLMAYWLYRTFNHQLGIGTATIFDGRVGEIWNSHEDVIMKILGNPRVEHENIKYENILHNFRPTLSLLLQDLEYIGILHNNGIIKFDILFNMFAPIFIAMNSDADVKKYIDDRRRLSTIKSSKPYDNVLFLMNKCTEHDKK